MSMIKRNNHARDPRQTSHNNRTMHDLMAGTKDVEFPRPVSLWKVEYVGHSAQGIEQQCQSDSPKREPVRLAVPTVYNKAVDDRCQGGESKSAENPCSERFCCRLMESWSKRNNARHDSKARDLSHSQQDK